MARLHHPIWNWVLQPCPRAAALLRANVSVAREASFGSVLLKRSARAALVGGSDQKAPSTFNTEFGPENGRVPLPFNPMSWDRTPHGRRENFGLAGSG